MPPEEHLRCLERMYLAAPTNQYYQPKIRIQPGAAEVWLTVRPDLFHTAGALHGAVYFKLLDDAAFFAANSLVPDVFVLTASFQLDLLRPVTGGELRATGRVTYEGKERFLAEAELRNDAGQLVARGNGNFQRSRVLLGPEVGYR